MITDARRTNWQFVLPADPADALLLPAGGDDLATRERLEQLDAAARRVACDGAVRPAVVAPDVSGWARDCGLRAADVLGLVAGAVAPGGHLYAGFANALFPARPAARTGLTLRACRRVLAAAGLDLVAAYVTLPDHRLPALMVPTEGDGLAYVLRHQVFAFSASSSRLVGPAQRAAVRTMRAVALSGPAGARVALAPAYGVLARRPEAGS